MARRKQPAYSDVFARVLAEKFRESTEKRARDERIRDAAPEMLDALKALAEECEEYELGNPAALRAARAAIAKAEGEP